MSTPSIIEQLISNVSKDQALLEQAEERISEAKEEKRNIQNRLKDYQKEVEVVMKYATPEQTKQLEALHVYTSSTKHGLNTVATTAYDIMLNSKKKSMTNEELYDAYIESLGENAQPVTYTIFNVKCRPLFNNQRLLREKGRDPKSSRTDVIKINGGSQQSSEKKK